MRQKTKTILIVVAGSMMIAHGLRMMTQGLFFPQSIYPAPLPTSLDFWFDWFTLAVIGFFLFLYGVQSFYEQQKKKDIINQPVIHPT